MLQGNLPFLSWTKLNCRVATSEGQVEGRKKVRPRQGHGVEGDGVSYVMGRHFLAAARLFSDVWGIKTREQKI
jgi:hypothetical protein